MVITVVTVVGIRWKTRKRGTSEKSYYLNSIRVFSDHLYNFPVFLLMNSNCLRKTYVVIAPKAVIFATS